MNDPSFLFLVGLALAAGIFLLTLLNTNAAIMLLIVSMLLSPEIPLAHLPSRDVAVRADDLLLIVMFFTWLAKLAINKQLGLIRSTPLNGPVGAFILACIVSTAWGIANGSVDNPLAGFFYLLKYIEFFVLYFMVANVVRERAQVERFITALLITAACVLLYGYWQVASHGTGWRITAPFEGKAEPNTLAGYVVLIQALCLGLGLHSQSASKRLALVGFAGLMIPLLLFTYSRSGYLAFIAMYVSCCLLSKRYRPALWGLLVLGALAAPMVVPASVMERLGSTFDPRGQVEVGHMRLSHSPAARVLIWKYIGEKWKERPLLGFGITGIGFVDSQYVLVIGELGLLGLAAFLWMQGSLLSVSRRTFKLAEDPLAKGLSLGFFAGFIGLLVQSLAGNIFIIVRIMEPFWLLAAIITVLPQVLEVSRPLQADGAHPSLPLRQASNLPGIRAPIQPTRRVS